MDARSLKWLIEDRNSAKEKIGFIEESIESIDSAIIANLLTVLESISSMCVGEVAMGVGLDAGHIGNMIYMATDMSAEELTNYIQENMKNKGEDE